MQMIPKQCKWNDLAGMLPETTQVYAIRRTLFPNS